MNRRQALSAAGSGLVYGLAGCTDPILSVLNDCEHSMPEDGATEAGDGFPTLSIPDEMPYTTDDEYSIAVWMTEQYSNDSVAKLRVEVLNQREQSREDNWGSTPPFSGYRGDHADREAAMYVAPSPPEGTNAGIAHVEDAEVDHPSQDLSAPIDGCWRIDHVGAADIDETVSFDPCGTLRETYSVCAAAENDGCLPAGRFRFEDPPIEFELLVEHR